MSQNYFNAGMTWLGEAGDTSGPEFTLDVQTVWLEDSPNDNNHEFVMMEKLSECIGLHYEVTRIYTNGDKVFFKENKTTEEWTVLYDFDLAVGAGTYVGIIPYPWTDDSKAMITYVKCVDRYRSLEYSNIEVMVMEEYEDENCSTYYGKGLWMVGIGCSRGVLNNSFFEADGAYGRLIKAYNADTVYFNAETVNSINSSISEQIIKVEGNQVVFSGIPADSNIDVFALDGKRVKSICSNLENLSIQIDSPGIYYLRFSGNCKKILIH